jgi:hypothetical protein
MLNAGKWIPESRWAFLRGNLVIGSHDDELNG